MNSVINGIKIGIHSPDTKQEKLNVMFDEPVNYLRKRSKCLGAT